MNKEWTNKKILDYYIKTFRFILTCLLDAVGSTPVLVIWSQTLRRSGAEFPLLKDLTVNVSSGKRFPFLKSIRPGDEKDPTSRYREAAVDLDINALEEKVEDVDRETLVAAFEHITETFYSLCRVILGTTVKLPELEKTDKGFL
jgi:hypothetical protein